MILFKYLFYYTKQYLNSLTILVEQVENWWRSRFAVKFSIVANVHQVLQQYQNKLHKPLKDFIKPESNTLN